MKTKISIILLCVFVLSSCFLFEKAPLSFDIQEINNSDTVIRRALGGSSRSYLPSGASRWITPTSFVIKVGTVAVNDEEGTFITLYDEEEDQNCVTIDLAKGESLSDKIDLTKDYPSEVVAWIGIAILPEITYQYQNNGGDTLTGVINLDTAGGGGINYEIGEARGRKAYDLDLYEPDKGWGDTRLKLATENPRVTLFVDLENVLIDTNGDGVVEDYNLDTMFFPAAGETVIEYYYLRNAAGSEEIYPYELVVMKTRDGLPIFGQQHCKAYFDSSTLAYQIDELGSFQKAGDESRNSVLTLHEDGSFDFFLNSEAILSNIGILDRMELKIGDTNCVVLKERRYPPE